MKERKKRWLALLMAFVMVISIMPLNVSAEGTDDTSAEHNISAAGLIIEENGEYTVTGATTANHISVADGVKATITLKNVSIKLSDGTVDSNATDMNNFGTAAIVLGEGADVTLNLVGENTLESGQGRAGIEVPGKYVHKNGTKTECTPASLTIEGNGSLAVNTSDLAAAIGAGFLMNAGNITINSGTITAKNTSNAAAIGGSHAGDGVGTIYGSFGTITITGGIVNATGANTAAAIGNGCHGNNGADAVINISGGIVTANGGSYSNQPDDIGMGYRSGAQTTPTVNISGNAIVIADKINKKMNGPVNHTGGIIVNGSTATMAGSMELGMDYTLSSGTTLTIPAGETLVIPFGKTLIVDGKIQGEGSVMLKGGTVENEENITCTLVKGDYFLELSVSPSSQTYNQEITLTAIVKKTADDSVASDMTGQVTFTCGDTELGTAELTAGTATLKTTVNYAAGTYKMKAAWTYNETANTDEASVTVTKAEQAKAPSAPAKAVTVASTSVELEAVTDEGEGNVEYGYALKPEAEGEAVPGNWQADTTIKNLLPGKTYLFYSRFVGNEYYNPIVSENALEVTTTALPTMTAPVLSEEPEANSLFAITLTIPEACKELEEAVIQYSMSSDNGETWGNWQTSNKFSGLSEGQVYQFRARYAMPQYEHYSEASNVVTLTAQGIVIPEENYDIWIGDSAAGTDIYTMRVSNINISGVKVVKHSYDEEKAEAIVILDPNTDKTSPIQFVFDCNKDPAQASRAPIDRSYIMIKGSRVGTMYPIGDGISEGKHVHTLTPVESTSSYTNFFVWDEDGEASFGFEAYGGASNCVKTYTVILRIGSEENTAPVIRKGISNEVSADITLGEGYSVVLKEIFEDKELEEMTYTVSVNGGEPEAVSGEFYNYGPEEAGVTTLVFKAKDKQGLESEPYTVKITAMKVTTVDIGGTAVDAWNSDIKKIEIGQLDITSVTKSEKEKNTWYIIVDPSAKKEDAVFFRVFGSARAGRWGGVNINGASVEGAESDGTNFIWSAYYTPEWNECGEATLVFNALPQNDNYYVYTLKLKIPNTENKAPGFADGNSKTEEVVQYVSYTADVASMFKDDDDTWLTYSVSVNDGDYTDCGAEHTYTPLTEGKHELSFKAKDIAGAESQAFVLTLNASKYEHPEGAYIIDNYKNNGALLNMTILDNNGEKLEGVTFETDDSVEGTKTITVNLPGTMKSNDQVKASFTIVQNDAKEPFLSTKNGATGNTYNLAVNNKTAEITTNLSQAKGSATLYWYGSAPTSDEDNVYDTYVINYQIVREDNKAPVLADGVEAEVSVTIDQYETYNLDLSTIFTDQEGDELTYTVKVNEEEAAAVGKDYSYEAKTDEDVVFVFQATDSFGSVSDAYTVNLTVNQVYRAIVETGDLGHNNGNGFGGTVKTIFIDGQKVEDISYTKNEDNTRVLMVQLDKSVPDDGQIKVSWEESGNAGNQGSGAVLNPGNPIQLVDGKATATLTTTGNFFFSTHYTYELNFSKIENQLPTLAEGVLKETAEDIILGSTYELDLSEIFTDSDGDKLTYSVQVNGGEETAAEAVYCYTPNKTGTDELIFRAKDAWGSSETYTVTLTVKVNENTYDITVKVPDTVNPTFYTNTGFTAEGIDITGDPLTMEKGQSENGWTSYTIKVPENFNRISFRGTDGTNDWGGMTIPTEKDMEAVTIRQVQAVINTKIDSEEGKVGLTKDQAVFKIKYDNGQYAVSGSTGTDQYGYLYYRFLLIAGDNELVYTYFAEPLGELTKSYNTNIGNTKTVTTDDATVMTTTLPLALMNPCKITVPVDAEVEMFHQAGYYNGIEVTPHETIDNGDGTKSVIFNDRGMFRVSKKGEITKAGYTVGDELTIDWDGDDRGPGYRRDYETVTDNWMAGRGDDSMYVNVNYRNNLQLAVGEEFQLRAYRIWEIINTDTNNIMIEPDFHYEILSGEDVISVTPFEGCSGGNAKGNWMDMKGLKEGTAVLEVTYDAIDIISGGDGDFGNPAFTYNACDPARTALIVVQVGSEKNDIDFAIDANREAGWDVEFDTLYFTGDSAKLEFSPKSISGTKEIAKVEVSNNKGISYTTLTAGEDGVYTANIVSGNNILRVTTTDGTESYQLVRGDKIKVTVTEVEKYADKDGIIEKGEKIQVRFHGVHNVIGKMSGIYNPTDYKTNFTYNGDVISGNGGQYTYPSSAYVDVTLPGNAKDGDSYTLTNGNTTNGGWGSAGGAHRAVTGEVPPNLDADGITNNGRNIFPEITLTIGDKTSDYIVVEAEDVTLNKTSAEVEIVGALALTATVKPDDATNKTVTWTSSDESVATVNAEGVVNAVECGTATITATTINGKKAECVVTVIEQAAVTDVEYLINQIGEVTLDSKEAIEAARSAYNALSDMQKSRVDNVDVLETAERTYAQLVATKADEEAAKAVDEKIAAIGEVELTETCEGKIREAREAYDALTDTQKNLVEKLDKLTEAEAEYARLKQEAEIPKLDCGLDESDILGWVTISFEDFGERLESELAQKDSNGNYVMDEKYREPLGVIVKAVKVPFVPYDTIAGVTLRALEALGMRESHTGSATSGFYLSSIGNFEVNGIYYDWFGEFDAGQGSGWMITWTDKDGETGKEWFINKGASEFMVGEGDEIKWKYTCQLGADIGDDRAENEVRNVEELIDAIGDTVELSDEEAILAAREAYDKLDSLQKGSVDNYAALEEAETKLEELKKEAEDKAEQEAKDQEAAKAVEDKIEAIGEVSLESEEAIKEAREAYEGLTDEQKALVTNLGVLEAAEARLEELKTEEPDEPGTEEPPVEPDEPSTEEPPVEPDEPEKPEEEKSWLDKLFDKIFGNWWGDDDDDSDEPTTEEPDEPSTEEPPVEPDVPEKPQEPDSGNWFGKLFNNIFGWMGSWWK